MCRYQLRHWQEGACIESRSTTSTGYGVKCALDLALDPIVRDDKLLPIAQSTITHTAVCSLSQNFCDHVL